MAANARYLGVLAALSVVVVGSTLVSLVDGDASFIGRAYANLTITGACCFNASCEVVNATICSNVGGTFNQNMPCSVCDTPTASPTATPSETATATPSASPSATPSATPTRTPVAQGGGCTSDGECQTDFCVNGVCCDQACTGNGQFCNALGFCVSAAPVPAVSENGLLLVCGLLGVIALAGLFRRGAARGPRR